MSAADLRRTRFAYSPLAEVAESLHMIASGRIHFLHRAGSPRCVRTCIG
jgi:hypothetical protein